MEHWLHNAHVVVPFLKKKEKKGNQKNKDKKTITKFTFTKVNGKHAAIHKSLMYLYNFIKALCKIGTNLQMA